MRCPECRAASRVKAAHPAGEEGTRRTYLCSEPTCRHEFQTLEVVVGQTNGRDAAKRQAAAIRGEQFIGTKDLRTLRLEAAAESAEFKWGILATYPCTAPELARTLGIRADAAERRLKHLYKLGVLSRREIRVGYSKSRAFEYEFLPSHKRSEGARAKEE